MYENEERRCGCMDHMGRSSMFCLEIGFRNIFPILYVLRVLDSVVEKRAECYGAQPITATASGNEWLNSCLWMA